MSVNPSILQVFNQYLEPGGEEVWVNEVTRFSGKSFEINDLRFRSLEWTGRGAPTLLRQARRLWDNPESRARLRAAVENARPDVLIYHNLIPVGSLGLYDEARALGLPVVQYIHNFRPFSASGTMWVNGRVNPAGLRGNPWPEVMGRAWERSFLKTFLVSNYQSKLVSSGTLDVVRRWIAVSEFMRERFIEADLLYLPLTDATANNAVVEAMACGLPMILTDFPATRAYAGDTAFYVQPADDAGACSLIAYLINDLCSLKMAATACRERAKNELSWEVVVQSHVEYFAEI